MLKPGENERVRFARDFLVRLIVVADAVEGYLAGNLERLIREGRTYERDMKAASQTGGNEMVLFDRATIFRKHGLSFDTSLEPNLPLKPC